jgi:hypothetical protein
MEPNSLSIGFLAPLWAVQGIGTDTLPLLRPRLPASPPAGRAYGEPRRATSRSSVRQPPACVREDSPLYPILAYPRYARHGFPLATRQLPSGREGSKMGALIALARRLMPSAFDTGHDRRGSSHACVGLYRCWMRVRGGRLYSLPRYQDHRRGDAERLVHRPH